MSLKETETVVERLPNPSKRVCLTLDLAEEPELIRKYVEHHSAEKMWREINEGIKEAGIVVMDIYIVDNRLFMICEVDAEADFDECWEKMGTFPRQDEWAELMRNFQRAVPGHPFGWVKMKKIYRLP